MFNIKAAVAAGVLTAAVNTGFAENVNLAQLDTQTGGEKVTVQLWGEQLPSGYADQLLLLIKDGEGKVQGAFKPTVPGGYNFLLQEVSLKKDSRQLLLSAAQGDWASKTQYRVLDIDDLKDIKELFDFNDNAGVVKAAAIDGKHLRLTMEDGHTSSMQIDEALFTELAPKKRQADYSGLDSLTVRDLDGDGVDELLSVQKVRADREALADVGAVWKLDEKGSWDKGSFTVLVAGHTERSNTINDGYENDKFTIMPKKIVLPCGEATYPVFVCRTDRDLQQKIEKLLAAECEPYLSRFYTGEADMAFNVLRADDKLLTIQLISGKSSFTHHHVHIDPVTGTPVRLADILNTEDKDLLPMLDLLNTNKNIEIKEGLPSEWYMNDGKLYLLFNICGKEEVSGYALGNLHKFIKNKKWLSTD